MKILAIYDGTVPSKAVLQYGLRKALDKSNQLLVLHMFQSMRFDYGADPRAEEIARAEAARQQRDAEAIIRGSESKGVFVRVLSQEGDTVEEAVCAAYQEKADLIIAPPRYKALLKKAPCLVCIIPYTILLPVDSSKTLKADLDTIDSLLGAGI